MRALHSRDTMGRLLATIWATPPVLFTLTMLFWSGNILLGRAMAGHVPPVALAQMRWSLALLVLLAFTHRRLAADWPVVRRRWRTFALLGALGIAVYNAFVYKGLETTSAVNGALLAAIFPLVIAAIGFVVYRDRLSWTQAVGIVAACAGAALILSGGDLSVFVEFRLVPGDLWIIAAQIAYGAYTVFLRERPDVHPLTLLTVSVFFGQLFLMPATALEAAAGARVTFDTATVLAVGYVVIFPAIVAFVLFNQAVKLVGSNRAAPYFNLVPMFAVVGAILFLGEEFRLFHAVGWAIIVAGVALAQREREPAGATR